MPKQTNGTKYEYFVEGFFSRQYGWEEVDTADTQADIEDSLKTYQENDAHHQYRWRKRKVKPQENERGMNEQ